MFFVFFSFHPITPEIWPMPIYYMLVTCAGIQLWTVDEDMTSLWTTRRPNDQTTGRKDVVSTFLRIELNSHSFVAVYRHQFQSNWRQPTSSGHVQATRTNREWRERENITLVYLSNLHILPTKRETLAITTLTTAAVVAAATVGNCKAERTITPNQFITYVQFRFTPAAPVDSSLFPIPFLFPPQCRLRENQRVTFLGRGVFLILFSFFGLPSELNVGWVFCLFCLPSEHTPNRASCLPTMANDGQQSERVILPLTLK